MVQLVTGVRADVRAILAQDTARKHALVKRDVLRSTWPPGAPPFSATDKDAHMVPVAVRHMDQGHHSKMSARISWTTFCQGCPDQGREHAIMNLVIATDHPRQRFEFLAIIGVRSIFISSLSPTCDFP